MLVGDVIEGSLPRTRPRLDGVRRGAEEDRPAQPILRGQGSPGLATLRSYVEALGGNVKVVATFGNRKLVLSADA